MAKDYGLSSGSPWVDGAIVAGAVYALTAVAYALPATPPPDTSLIGVGAVGVGVAAVGALCSVVSTLNRSTPERHLVRLGCWSGLGAWLTWALHTTPWSMDTAGALLGGCLVGLHLLSWSDAKPAPTEEQTALASKSAPCREWESRIIRRDARFKGVVVTAVTPWDNAFGEDVTVVLPEGSATIDDLTRLAEGLATDANLPSGCGIQVLPTDSGRKTVTMRVSTVNRLSSVIGYPLDRAVHSMTDPTVFGEHPNGTAAEGVIRQRSVLISGPIGSGKTTVIQAASAETGLTTDGLVWHLDLNGGGLSQPWVDVWLDGTVKRCPIDWPAANLEESIAALQAAVRIAKHRKGAYRKRKREANSSLLPIGPDLPMINIWVDEGAEAVKDARLEKLLVELQNIGRDSGVLPHVCSLFPTSEMIPPSMRRNSGVRIQMYSPDEEVYGHMFGWSHQKKNSELAGPGTGFISVQGADPSAFRARIMEPATIEELAVRVAEVRPELDGPSAAAAGEAYADRWDRVRAFFAFDDDGAPPVQHAAPEPPAGGGSAEGWASPYDIAAQTSGGSAVAVAEAPARTTTRVPRELAWITDAAVRSEQERVRTTWLIDEVGLDMTPRRLGMLLAAWGAPIGRQDINGTEIRGPLVTDLRAAVARIEDGGPIDITPQEAP